MRDEHRHARAILAAIEDLLCFEIVWIELHFRRAKNRLLAGLKIESVNRPRTGEAGEGIKCFAVCSLSGEATNRADCGKTEITNEFAIALANANERVGIVEISEDELIVHEVDAEQTILGFRDDFAPMGSLRLRDVDGDEPSLGCVVVGA